MLKITCNMCAGVLTEPGGLFFYPPDGENNCKKVHICVNCLPFFKDSLHHEKLGKGK